MTQFLEERARLPTPGFLPNGGNMPERKARQSIPKEGESDTKDRADIQRRCLWRCEREPFPTVRRECQTSCNNDKLLCRDIDAPETDSRYRLSTSMDVNVKKTQDDPNRPDMMQPPFSVSCLVAPRQDIVHPVVPFTEP